MDFTRIQGTIDVEALQQKHVTLFGAGASVSLVTDLTRCGVSRWRLVDPDRVGPENMSRQEHDPEDVGQFKVDAVRAKIRQLNPDAEAQRALDVVRQWTVEHGLRLHPEKTHIADTEGDGFEFLGYLIKREHRWPRRKSLQKLKDTIRQKTRRTSGRSMSAIIADVNRTLVGWFEYFKHSHHWVFGSLDGWIRMRLRSILRHWHRRKGRGRGRDHNRWPNAHFHAAGLFSLKGAWCQLVNPLGGHQSSESRMRQTRTSGSEGGGAETNRLSLPLST